MIPLADFANWASHLDASALQYLSPSEHAAYQSIPAAERNRQLKTLLGQPIAHFSAVTEAFFRARWGQALRAIDPKAPLTLLEVASGDADVIPQVMGRDYPDSRYITSNMNRRLTAGLVRRIKDLPLAILVIEEDAARIEQHLRPESVDIIAFQHAVNDVIQAILCDREAIDTVDSDWMETLPAMIRILQGEIAQGTLAQHAQPGFLTLLENLLKVLKPGGHLIMGHHMYQLDLDWGYPPGLWENMIPTAREWIKDLPGVQEVAFEGFDPQWWLFTRKG